MPKKTDRTLKFEIIQLKDHLDYLEEELKILEKKKKKILKEGSNTFIKIKEKEKLLKSRKK